MNNCALKSLTAAPCRQCGYPHESLSFLSSGNVLLLTLMTDGEKNFPGFRANYSQIPINNPGTGPPCCSVLRGTDW